MCTGAGVDSDTLQRLQNRYGVDIVIDEVVEVDPIRTAERLVSGAQLSADRIIMAPGISLDPMPGRQRRQPRASKLGRRRSYSLSNSPKCRQMEWFR